MRSAGAAESPSPIAISLARCARTPAVKKSLRFPGWWSIRSEGSPPKLSYPVPGPSKLDFIKTTLLSAWRGRPNHLVVCGHLNLLPVAFLASLITKAPLLTIVYGIDAWTPRRNPAVNWLANRASAVISISRVTAERFAPWSGFPQERLHLLPTTIDLSRYCPGPKPPQLLERYRLEGKRVIMTLGRLSADERYKGFDEVMEALPEIQKIYPDTVYMVAGDGTDRARLKQKAQKLGLTDYVIFTGFVREDEKNRALSSGRRLCHAKPGRRIRDCFARSHGLRHSGRGQLH